MADGLLSNILNFIDQKKQSTMAGLGLLANNPQEYLTSRAEQLRDFTRAQEAGLIADRNQMRGLPVTQEQQMAQQYANKQLQDIGSGFAGTFIGKGSKIWNQPAEAKFLELEKKGLLPQDIWKQTGVYRGAEGKLRQEISDLPAIAKFDPNFSDIQNGLIDAYSKLQYNKPYSSIVLGEERANVLNLANRDLEKLKQGFVPPVKEILSHKDLYAAYPDLGNISTNIGRGKYGQGNFQQSFMTEGGAKNPVTTVINENIKAFAPNENELKNVLLHELQHGIQSREGFARGGSPVTPYELGEKAKYMQSTFDEFKNIYKNQNYSDNQIMKLAENYVDSTLGKRKYYERLAGEAEARAVQSRMNMTPEQRLQVFPYQSFDIPKERLIIKGLLK